MRIDQLKCLVDIAETGSLTATAQRLFVSQQAVSKSMKQLEEELDIEILIRTNMGVQITPEGLRVVEFAQKVLEEEAKLTDDIKGVQHNTSEEVVMKICSTSAVTNIVLPNIINELDARQQNIKFKISMVDSLNEIIRKVEEKECDIGLVTYNADELLRRFSTVESDVYLDILARDEMIALMNKRYLKNEDGTIRYDEFVKHPMTLYNVIPVERQEDDIFYEIRNDYMTCSNDADFHRTLMEKNGAIVIMPSLAQRYFFTSKKIVPIEFPLDTLLLHAAIYRKDADAIVQDIAMMIRREMQSK